MKNTLKNIAVFFSAATLIGFCYPQFGSQVSSAKTFEPQGYENSAAADDKDNKAIKKIVSTASASKPAINDATEATNAPANSKAELIEESPATAYHATAYTLRGRTATGAGTKRGIIAADPRVLPLGTRVRLSAGTWSGTYTVADTGGAVKGRKIDLWVPNNSEARQFGRRKVMLTVINRKRSN